MAEKITLESLAADMAALRKENAELKDAQKAAQVPPNMIAVPKASDLDDYKDGTFVQRSNGEEFKHKLVKDDPRSRIHKLKNEEHFTEYTDEEFRQLFDKK